MRIRSIKPEFWTSESVGRLSRDARLLFIALWSFADDSGKGRGAFPTMSGALFPFDPDALEKIPAWFAELQREGMVRRYVAKDGNTYYDIPKWLQHQKIEKPSRSRLPDFTEHSPSTPRTLPEISPPGSRILDLGSRILDLGSEEKTLAPPATPQASPEPVRESDQGPDDQGVELDWDDVQHHNPGNDPDQDQGQGQDSDPKAGGDQAQDPKTKRKRRTKDDFSEHGFQIFWQSYPKRVGIAKAYEFWCKKMDPSERLAAADGVYDFSNGKETKWLPDPERYLKYKRWLDEPVPEPVPEGQDQ